MRDYWTEAKPTVALLFVPALLVVGFVWYVRRRGDRWPRLSSAVSSPRFWTGLIVFAFSARYLAPIFLDPPWAWADADSSNKMALFYILLWPLAWFGAAIVWFRRHRLAPVNNICPDNAKRI